MLISRLVVFATAEAEILIPIFLLGNNEKDYIRFTYSHVLVLPSFPVRNPR